MKDKIVAWISNRRWFLGFTAVFAVLMAYVFWGTRSPDVAAVMPDDGVCHPLSFGVQLRGAINGFLAGGKLAPGDVFANFPVVSKYWLQEFKYAFAGYCAALGLAYYLRGRGLSNVASYGAGLFLGFCGYWFSLFSAGHAGWFYWMTYGVFAFGLAERAVRFGKLRHWILLGACVAWGSFYQPDLWLLFTVLTGAYTLAVCAWERRFPWKGMLVSAVAFGVIGAPGVVGAFGGALADRDEQIAASMKPLSEAEKADPVAKAKAEREARWIFVTHWSLPQGETVEFFNARVNGDTSCPMTLQCARAAGKDTKPYTGALGRPLGANQGNYRQHALYVGWITCLLALVGVAGAFFRQSNAVECDRMKSNAGECGRGRSGAVVGFFAVAAVLCWLLSLGRFCEPVYRVVFALPFGDYLRAPVKWHHLTEFCLCVLAGFGLEALCRLLASKFCSRAALLAVGAVANPNDKGVRFLWAGTQQVAQNKSLAVFVKARATPVGYCAVTQKGVFSVQPGNANVALYQLNGVPVPEKKSPWREIDWGVLAMGVVSVLGSFAALCLAACEARPRFFSQEF